MVNLCSECNNELMETDKEKGRFICVKCGEEFNMITVFEKGKVKEEYIAKSSLCEELIKKYCKKNIRR